MIECIAAIAAFAAGLMNAIAGGGTLISFPVLLALGIPPVTANITNTLALCPGYLGGVFAQRKQIAFQKKRLIRVFPLSILGGLAGGFLLIHLDEKIFGMFVPFLILFASFLLAVQNLVKKWLKSRSHQNNDLIISRGGYLLLFISAVYGGYFGAGASVIIIAVLGILYDDSLASLNVLKLMISFSVNITATVYFVFSGSIEWVLVLVMGTGSVLGGFCGGILVERIHPDLFRWIIVIFGFIVAGLCFSGRFLTL